MEYDKCRRFPRRASHQYLSAYALNDFIKDQAAAFQLSSSTGIAYTDAQRQVNYQTQQLLLDEMNQYTEPKITFFSWSVNIDMPYVI